MAEPAGPSQRGFGSRVRWIAALSVLAVALAVGRWHFSSLRETAKQRALLERLAAALDVPSTSAPAMGLDARFAFACEVIALEDRSNADAVSKAVAAFGEGLWSGVGHAPYDDVLREFAHRRFGTALSQALAGAQREDLPLEEQRRLRMIAGHLLAANFLRNVGAVTVEQLYRAALARTDRAREPLAWSEAQLYLAKSLPTLEEIRSSWKEPLHAREEILGVNNPSLLRWEAGLVMVAASAEEAAPYGQRALEMQKAHPSLLPKEMLVLLAVDARGALNREQYVEAEPILRQAVAIAEKLPAESAGGLGQMLCDLGEALTWQERSREAEPFLLRGLPLVENAVGSTSVKLVRPLLSLAKTKHDLGRLPTSEALANRALKLAESLNEKERAEYSLQAIKIISAVMRDSGRENDAEPLYLKALAWSETVAGPESRHVAAVLNNLAVLLRHQGRLTEAERHLRRAMTIEDKLLPAGDPQRAWGLGNLGLLVAYAGRPEEGETFLRRALALQARQAHPTDLHYAVNFNNLGQVLVMEGRAADAEAPFAKALAIAAKLEALAGDRPPETKEILANYTGCFVAEGIAQPEAQRRVEAAFQEALTKERSAKK